MKVFLGRRRALTGASPAVVFSAAGVGSVTWRRHGLSGFCSTSTRGRRSLKDEVEDDVAGLRGLSLEERGKILESVCRDAMAIITARPDAAKALAAQEPRSAESLELWRTLVRRYRADGRD